MDSLERFYTEEEFREVMLSIPLNGFERVMSNGSGASISYVLSIPLNGFLGFPETVSSLFKLTFNSIEWIRFF